MKKLLLICALFGCTKPANIRYSVICDDCMVTYTTATGGTSQVSSVKNFSYEFEPIKDNLLYVSAQNNNAYGTVVCKILQNAEVLDQAKSDGAYVIATAKYQYR